MNYIGDDQFDVHYSVSLSPLRLCGLGVAAVKRSVHFVQVASDFCQYSSPGVGNVFPIAASKHKTFAEGGNKASKMKFVICRSNMGIIMTV